jgi:tRNA-2-methylthio-N6-dimethylallyladenosine synthase
LGEIEVLVEEISKKDPSSVYGRTRSDKNVVFKSGNELIGKLITVKIEKTGPATLVGSGKFREKTQASVLAA